MWIRLAKELRELALPWIQAVTLSLATALVRPGWALWVFALFAVHLACRLFGAELDHRTLPRLLAQPLARARIWGEKMLAGAVAIGAGYGTVVGILELATPDPPSFGTTSALAALVALATGPTLSLWLRDSLRALWASFALPANVYVASILAWTVASGVPQLPPVGAVFVPYCAVMLALGYRSFLRLELAAEALPDDGSPAGPEAAARPGRGLAGELVAKEIRLQRNSLLLVPVAAAAGLAAWLLSWFPELPIAGVGTLGDVLEAVGFLPSGVLILLVPVLLGANAVASERQLGVLPWQLAQPVSRRIQWRLKLAVCLLLASLAGALGVALAWVLASRLSPQAFAGLLPAVGQLAFVSLAVGLYGSRLGKSPFHALGLGLVFGAATWYVWNLLRYTAAFAGLLWPEGLAPYLDLGIGGLGPLSTVDLLVFLVLGGLGWAVPRQEIWLAGRGLLRSAGLATLAVLTFSAVAVQLYLLNLTSIELEREIAIHDAQIESLGGLASLDWLAAKLELEAELGVDRIADLIHVVEFAYSVARAEEKEAYKSLFPPVSRFMDLASLADGIAVSRHSVDLWYWGRVLMLYMERKELTQSDLTYRRAQQRLPEWFPTSRQEPAPWSTFSVAPLWFQEHRREQLDRRVRQNVILEALRMGSVLERRMALEPDRFEDVSGFRAEFFSQDYARADPGRPSTTDG